MDKKLIFGAVAALALPLVSCQEEVEGVRSGMVDYTISAGLPTALGTYASNQGGLNNVDESKYDLKYTMEVWQGDKMVYTASQTQKTDFEESVNFKVRLAATQYDFVFFAEFVKEGTEESLYTHSGLNNIVMNDRVYGDESADAYFANVDVDLSQASVAKSVTLKRKMGKIRLLATDVLTTGVTSVTPASAKITYTEATVPTTFNALTGEVSGSVENEAFTFTVPVNKEEKAVNGQDAYVIGFDYILPSADQTAYAFKVEVLDAAGNQIGYREVSNIPVQENKLTTVYGNFFSNEGDLTVNVDDAFNGEEEIGLADAFKAASVAELNELLAKQAKAIQITQDLTLTETLTLDYPVTLLGNATITTSGAATAMNVADGGVVIDGLHFVKTDKTTQDIIRVTMSGATIKNCTFEGEYVNGDSEVTRAIIPNAGVAVTVEGNTFRNLRQPGYFQGDGVVIRNNHVEGTRGFVVCADNQITLEGNTFANNAVDIAIIANGANESTYEAGYYDDVRALSEKNNGAFVENQYTKASAVGAGNSAAVLAALSNATTIEVLDGEYNFAEGISVGAGKTVNGSEGAKFLFTGLDNKWAVSLSGKLANVAVIYDTDRVAGTAWTTNPGGVNLLNGGVLEGCYVTKFRNGLYANNVSGIEIRNNVVDANRTGIQFANAVGATVEGNTFSNNETMGVLLQYMSANNNEKPTFTNNTFVGNWYSDFENRWTSEYVVDLRGNTFGNGDVPTVKEQATTGEPSSSETFTKPAAQVANVVTAVETNVIVK